MESFYKLGLLYDKLGNKKLSIVYLKSCLTIDKTHKQALNLLGNVLLVMEEFERAMKYFKHVLTFDEDSMEALYGLSLTLYRSYIKFNDLVNVKGVKHPDISTMRLKQIELVQAKINLKKILKANPLNS